MKLTLRSSLFSFRRRMVVIVLGLALAGVSLYFTNRMAENLREKEQHDVQVWAMAMERAIGTSEMLNGDPLMRSIISNRNNIPLIITNENLRVLESHLVPENIINHPDLLRRKIDQFPQALLCPVCGGFLKKCTDSHDECDLSCCEQVSDSDSCKHSYRYKKS